MRKSVPPHTVRVEALLARLGAERVLHELDGASAASKKPPKELPASAAASSAVDAAACNSPRVIKGSVVPLPTPQRTWADQEREWARVQGRAGVPPTDPFVHVLDKSGMHTQLHEQYLRMQSNVFALVDENRYLASTNTTLDIELRAARALAARLEEQQIIAHEQHHAAMLAAAAPPHVDHIRAARAMHMAQPYAANGALGGSCAAEAQTDAVEAAIARVTSELAHEYLAARAPTAADVAAADAAAVASRMTAAPPPTLNKSMVDKLWETTDGVEGPITPWGSSIQGATRFETTNHERRATEVSPAPTPRLAPRPAEGASRDLALRPTGTATDLGGGPPLRPRAAATWPGQGERQPPPSSPPPPPPHPTPPPKQRTAPIRPPPIRTPQPPLSPPLPCTDATTSVTSVTCVSPRSPKKVTFTPEGTPEGGADPYLSPCLPRAHDGNTPLHSIGGAAAAEEATGYPADAPPALDGAAGDEPLPSRERPRPPAGGVRVSALTLHRVHATIAKEDAADDRAAELAVRTAVARDTGAKPPLPLPPGSGLVPADGTNAEAAVEAAYARLDVPLHPPPKRPEDAVLQSHAAGSFGARGEAAMAKVNASGYNSNDIAPEPSWQTEMAARHAKREKAMHERAVERIMAEQAAARAEAARARAADEAAERHAQAVVYIQTPGVKTGMQAFDLWGGLHDAHAASEAFLHSAPPTPTPPPYDQFVAYEMLPHAPSPRASNVLTNPQRPRSAPPPSARCSGVTSSARATSARPSSARTTRALGPSQQAWIRRGNMHASGDTVGGTTNPPGMCMYSYDLQHAATMSPTTLGAVNAALAIDPAATNRAVGPLRSTGSAMGEAHNQTALLVRQREAARPRPSSARYDYPASTRATPVARRSIASARGAGHRHTHRAPPSSAVGYVPVASATWHRDGGRAAASTATAAELRLTLLCWGAFRRRWSAAGDGHFQNGVRQSLERLLLGDGIGAIGRAAVGITFPRGVPSDSELMSGHRPLSEPSLVVDLVIKLKGTHCLEEARKRVGKLSRLLGETTGCDSVECALSGERDAQPPAAAEPPPTRAQLKPKVNGKAIDKAQAIEREEKLARGEGAGVLHQVEYEWEWGDGSGIAARAGVEAP